MTEIFRPKVNFDCFRKTPVNSFALQQALKQVDIQYEYLIDGVWQDIVMANKPTGKRALFPDVSTFKKARETYFTWSNLSSLMKKEKPVFPEIIIQRLMEAAYSQFPLTIFIPWGYRSEGEFGQKEKKAMNLIDEILSLITQRKINTQVLLMPADLYATEINKLPKDKVDNYFSEVIEETNKRGYQALPWSKIRKDNSKKYDILKQRYALQEISKILPQFVIDSAIKAAAKRNQPKAGAFAYLKERVCEAEIIEELYRPIKLSMVTKNKDEGVDLKLPRLYLLPEWLQFPWL